MQPISTAILSFGMSGKLFHAPFIHLLPGFHLVAVWERSKTEAQAIYPHIKTYRSLEELLADSSIELVIVNTPNYTHFNYAHQALSAGKHVVIEKPFTTTAAEGEALIKLADENGLMLSGYHNRRYDSDFTTVKKVLAEGWLGNVVEAELHYDRYKPDLSPKAHKEVPGPATGALYDLGSHLIDQALQLFGTPHAVFADIQTLRPASVVDDYFELLLYYPRLRVRLHASYLVREPLPAYSFHGTKGSFIKTRADVQEAALLQGKKPGAIDWGYEPNSEAGLLHTEQDGEVIKKEVVAEGGNYAGYYKALYGAIREGGSLPVTGEEALQVIRIIEAAHRSSAEQRVVEL